MELTVNGLMPAPAWLAELVRSIAGNDLSASRTRRPANPSLFTPIRDTRTRPPGAKMPERHPPGQDTRYTSPQNVPPGHRVLPREPIARPEIPRIDGRDFILIYRLPDGTGARPRDIVVARFGRVELNAREVDITQQEILTKHPNATFLVLRQQTEIGRAGARWVRPDGGRIDPRWVERFESWP